MEEWLYSQIKEQTPGLQHSLFISKQTDVLLSLVETNRLKSTKPCFPPRGMETRMSHLPWGGCLYRRVAFDPFALRLANLPVLKSKKIWKGKQRGLILRVMQLDSWSLVGEKDLLLPCGHKKLWERNFISQKWAKCSMVWGEVFYFKSQWNEDEIWLFHLTFAVWLA